MSKKLWSLISNGCVVIKIGSSLLIDATTGGLNQSWLAALAADIHQLIAQRVRVIIVSSGAVALGCGQLRLPLNPCPVDKKQAAAAVGQIMLAHRYQQAFATWSIDAAQILLSLDDSENRSRFLNAKNTFRSLLDLNVVPIVNENDTVATEGIRYGDNDRLAARVAQMVDAALLIVLSDVDGLYSANPATNPQATLIDEVAFIDTTILNLAQQSATVYGTGGMHTKLLAGQMVTEQGIPMLLCNGQHQHPISQFMAQERGTWFLAKNSRLSAKKAWLKTHLLPRGRIQIDAGAKAALMAGKSLLPVGVRAVEGQFKKGDVVTVVSQQLQPVAIGLTNYPSDELTAIMGKQTSDIPIILGYDGIHEIIHRDNMVETSA